ncbi:hypothetical protein [Herbidospora mongoliensis]|uniref:hypothetical protein n=1 Tax=Herbidospora mongoliensis TaxID=688067 RepID=UPI000A811458|nr:hypothetical protein [Herbidospora mongoliensis]
MINQTDDRQVGLIDTTGLRMDEIGAIGKPQLQRAMEAILSRNPTEATSAFDASI